MNCFVKFTGTIVSLLSLKLYLFFNLYKYIIPRYYIFQNEEQNI